MRRSDSNYTDRIRQEQIRTLFVQSKFLFFGLLVLMSGVLFYFWDKTNNKVLLSWFLLNATLLVARAIFVKRFHKVSPQDEDIFVWGKIFALTSFLSGCLWGMFPVLFVEISDLPEMALMIIILSSMMATSLVPLSSYVAAYISYSIPAMLPLIGMLLTSSSSMFIFIGILLSTSLPALIAFSLVINRNMAASFQLRFENLELVKDLEKQKEMAEKANKDKSRFLAATSHDLRQPLHAMDLYLGALRNVLKTDEQYELLDKSQASSKALTELLNAIMDVSRLDAGSVNIEKRTINLKSLLNEVCQSMQPQAEQHRIKIKHNIANINVYSDSILLARMVRNLISNAIKHSEGNEILISLDYQDENVILNMSDNGIGIVNTEIENIFSEFYQLNNPERDRTKGIGLGLAIVKRIAQQLDHFISVSSELNQGSTFSITLPVANEMEELQKEKDDYVKYDLSGLFVIIIEDEKSVRDAMRSLLRSCDCEVLIGDSLDAINEELDKVTYPVPEVIISDYRLRENKTGLGAIKKLRERFDQAVPAIVVTGDTSKEIAESITQQHCELIYKPVNADNLQAIIAAVAST